MISYAQNGEDVVLARALPSASGFYVDVGASHPDIASVTKYFYDLGWSGINIDPRGDVIELLRERRPRDTNLEFAAGATDGSVDFYVVVEDPDLSTMDSSDRDFLEQRGYTVTTQRVQVRTLDSIFIRHGVAEIDFLKVDVEGSEQDVLVGLDLNRWKPRVLVVESVRPWSSERTDDAWRGMLEDRGYKEGGFDGINLYFAHTDDSEVLGKLAPASALDKFQTAARVALDAELGRVRAYVRDLESEVDRNRRQQEELLAHIRQLGSSWPPRADIVNIQSGRLFSGDRSSFRSATDTRSSALRIAVISPPHSGDDLLARLLSEAIGADEIEFGHPGDVDWEHLPEEFVLRLHWQSTRRLRAVLNEKGIRVVGLARHPFDLLLSMNASVKSADDRLDSAASEESQEARLRTAGLSDETFIRWATSEPIKESVSITAGWWKSPSTVRVVYEELLSDPEGTVLRTLEDCGLGGSIDRSHLASLIARSRLRTVAAHPSDSTGPKATTWIRAFTPVDLKILFTAYSTTLKALGYASTSAASTLS